MGYLRINKRFRVFLFILGVTSFSYGLYDIHRDQAGRSGLNSTPENSPTSYYFTISKKTILGAVLILVSVSPLLGNSKKD
ncbi:hypothetical protein C7Y69_21375 [Alteromonas sp. KS69]|nr:hypothetical protein C7Y69_21375 [Alteromonas sp. KS69]|tara:strand:+ start:529 stop:768 length:240 start_codon:yes stop_codon:yes gene_type:complete